ncbi:MAG: hypothetical protein LUQ64_01915, partial [Methanomicrobiales archaeon]|nr:hypothetical protein [Methanomicrobiales archaeon]
QVLGCTVGAAQRHGVDRRLPQHPGHLLPREDSPATSVGDNRMVHGSRGTGGGCPRGGGGARAEPPRASYQYS